MSKPSKQSNRNSKMISKKKDYGDMAPNISSLSTKRKRSSIRTDAQLKLLKSKAPASHLNYVELSLAWESLSTKLNEIGPPCHSASGWRKLWANQKAKSKRQMTSSECNDEVKQCYSHCYNCIDFSDEKEFCQQEVLETVDSVSKTDESIKTIPTVIKQLEVPVEMCGRSGDETARDERTLIELSKKVDTVVNQQTTLIEQQNTLIEQQKLLFETVQKLSNASKH